MWLYNGKGVTSKRTIRIMGLNSFPDLHRVGGKLTLIFFSIWAKLNKQLFMICFCPITRRSYSLTFRNNGDSKYQSERGAIFEIVEPSHNNLSACQIKSKTGFSLPFSEWEVKLKLVDPLPSSRNNVRTMLGDFINISLRRCFRWTNKEMRFLFFTSRIWCSPFVLHLSMKIFSPATMKLAAKWIDQLCWS